MPRSKSRVPGGPRLKSSAIPRTRYFVSLSTEPPSPAAQHRYDVVRWYEEHGRVVRLAARRFGHSPDSVSRWVRAFALRHMRGLEDRSGRPLHVRRPTAPTAVVVRIRELRERYPRWGREKLRVLLLREGTSVSAKTIDRTLARLRSRGALHEPPMVRKAAQARLRQAQRPRRPAGLAVGRPGFLQLDSQETRFGGTAVFTFAAVEFLTRKRVVAAAAAGITQYTNRPNYPQGNGRVERSFLTDDQEFHEVEELAPTAEGLERQLVVWNRVYVEIRPHQALGYLTPNEFYAQWVAEHPTATTVQSEMS